jgi:hypothetical protein
MSLRCFAILSAITLVACDGSSSEVLHSASDGGASGSDAPSSGSDGQTVSDAATSGNDSGASACGPTTINANPFGCDFAWGASAPGGSLSSYSSMQFMTTWVEFAVKADGTFDSCNGCTWLKNSVASTNLIPVYYAYLIGFLGHANGYVDGNQCPANNPNCPTLVNGGAALIKSKRSAIIKLHADYAKQTHDAWPTKPLVWLLEGDFIQYTSSAQSSPLTMTELAQLAADITCAIKGNMPNAVVAINHSIWNPDQVTKDFWNAMKSAGVNYDLVWTTGVPDNNEYIASGTTSSAYNAATATYSFVHQLTGKHIMVDDGCGAETDEHWSTSPAATLNARITDGVSAFTHCGTIKPTYQSLITSLKPQLSSTCN